MIFFSIKNKIRIAHLITFMFFSCVVIFIVRPFWTDIQTNALKLFESNRDFNFIKEKSDKISLARSDYKNMEPDLSKMSGFLIDPKTPIDLIKFWESIAKEESLNIEIGSYPLEKEDNDLWPSMGFQIRLAGSYASVMKFLVKIESGQYFFEVKSLNIIKSADKLNEMTGQTVSGGVSANLGLKVHTKE